MNVYREQTTQPVGGKREPGKSVSAAGSRKPRFVARCGATIPHGAHRTGPRDPEWCAGNQNVVIGQPVPRGPVFVPHRAGHTQAEDHVGFIDGCPACARWQAFLTERRARIEETGE